MPTNLNKVSFIAAGKGVFNIYSVVGQKLTTLLIEQNGHNDIAIQSLENGIYMIEYIQDQKRSVGKLIVAK